MARRLARLLVERGDRVRGLIRNPEHADDLRADGSEPSAATSRRLDRRRRSPRRSRRRRRRLRRRRRAWQRRRAQAHGGPRRRDQAARSARSRRRAALRDRQLGRRREPPRRRRRLQRLPARQGRGRRRGDGERPRLDGRAARDAHRRPGHRARARADRADQGEVTRDDVAAVLAAVLHEPRSAGAVLYVVGGDDPIDEAWRGCSDEGRADDRGPGGRHLGGLAGARARLRGARRRDAVPLGPLPVGVRDARARLARRLGDDLLRSPPSPPRCGSARSSPPRPSGTRPSWRRSPRRSTTSPAGRVELGSAPAGTRPSTPRTGSRSRRWASGWTA